MRIGIAVAALTLTACTSSRSPNTQACNDLRDQLAKITATASLDDTAAHNVGVRMQELGCR